MKVVTTYVAHMDGFYSAADCVSGCLLLHLLPSYKNGLCQDCAGNVDSAEATNVMLQCRHAEAIS
jgi:hypothetical protein